MEVDKLEKFRMAKCANCGKDVEVGERPDEKCYWCHKSALKKEVAMNINELSPETVATIEEVAKQNGLPPPLPEVPPRPDTMGFKGAKLYFAVHKYYLDNRPAIRETLTILGDNSTCERWHIPQSTWKKLKYDIAPDVYGPNPHKRGRKTVKKQKDVKSKEDGKSAVAQEKACPVTSEAAEDVCPTCPVVIAYKAYRQAVVDMSGGKVAK